MTNIELYINNQLCEIQSPAKLGIRLNRVLINPAEFVAKDAQYSYSITLPTTSVNNHIFGYANVEEVRNKFNADYNALLIVDGVTIFDGKFRMSEINEESYKGNLVIMAPKTVKEIFGEKKMSEIEGSWDYDLKSETSVKGIARFINEANTDQGIPDCIFPYVLYGLIPKISNLETNEYTSKDLFDETVRLGIEDFPPSLNCLKAIKQIFQNTKTQVGNEEIPLNITGTAFEDERLQNLYMSYKNPTDHVQEWHWAHLGKMHLKGSWANYRKEIPEGGKKEEESFEADYVINDINESSRKAFVSNILKSKMCRLDKDSYDNGTNIIMTEAKDSMKNAYTFPHITIPHSGLYKITLDVNLKIDNQLKPPLSNKASKARFVHGIYKKESLTEQPIFRSNGLYRRAFEIKLLRDWGEGGFDITNMKFDWGHYNGNLPQKTPDNIVNGKGGWNKKIETPYYFPSLSKDSVMFIDPKVNHNLIGGFKWGRGVWGRKGNDEIAEPCTSTPDRENDANDHNHILSIKNGWSWDVQYSQKDKIFSAIKSPGYWAWGRPKDITNDTSLEEETAEGADENELQFNKTNRFKVELDSIENKIERYPDLNSDIDEKLCFGGHGKLHQMIWLEKGEHITLVSVSDRGLCDFKNSGGYIIHSVDFDLTIEPFKKTYDWLKIDNNGNGTEEMEWVSTEADKNDFMNDKLNLFKFLPSEEKVDDWLDNFCKAFNLQLTQTNNHSFQLNIKQEQADVANVIDLSSKTSLTLRNNQPLGLPNIYELGFKISKDEEGYEKTKNDGGGRFVMGTLDGKTLTQNSSFSYNWFKNIKIKNNAGQEISTPIPVITHKEIWVDNEKDYAEMMKKLYTNYSQRFWYRSNSPQTIELGKIWNRLLNDNSKEKHGNIQNVMLSEMHKKKQTLTLNYKNEPYSIMNTYFIPIVTNDSNYTDIECYLTPDEYEKLDGTTLVKYNSDLYYVAAIEGYDPTYLNKTKLKLIRKV